MKVNMITVFNNRCRSRGVSIENMGELDRSILQYAEHWMNRQVRECKRVPPMTLEALITNYLEGVKEGHFKEAAHD